MNKKAISLYRKATFLKSAEKLEHLPEDVGYEIAFAGYSNVGKSSVINSLTGIKSLARTSKTPGRTQLINLFTLDDERRLVDLPGYGFAKVPQATKKRWEITLAKYLETRACLRGLVLLMDSRHPLKIFDRDMIHWALESQLPIHVLLTKSDKLPYNGKQQALKQVSAALSAYPEPVSLQLFSATSHHGLDELCHCLNRWLDLSF